MIVAPFYPVIYVRGYAARQGDVEETTATPYMGFNLGSTKFRQTYTREVQPWVFESPLIRLMKDYGYVDAYSDGKLRPEGQVPGRSVWIFRYYDITSKDLGEGQRKEIEYHARALRDFILHVREHVLAKGESKDRFGVYLVAHSMGGLVCRAYLQNPDIPDLDGRTRRKNMNRGVNKLFTYATPHGGIEFRNALEWVEGLRDFLDVNNSGNFGPRRMRQFLGLGAQEPINSLAGRFPPERVFSLVGTNAQDYGAARRAVGPLSDGLVQMKNAYVAGSPRAYVYRSHSGAYGIVNSEEGYQNLKRFLFGDTRADLLLDGVNIAPPTKKNVKAVYFIDCVVVVRGVPVDIHRRTMSRESAIFRTHEEIQTRPTHLATCFLARAARVKKARASLGFNVRVKIIPQYHVDRKLWLDEHYEGKAIFEYGLDLEATPVGKGGYKLACRWSDDKEETRETLDLSAGPDGSRVAEIPFRFPLIAGKFVVRLSDWK